MYVLVVSGEYEDFWGVFQVICFKFLRVLDLQV